MNKLTWICEIGVNHHGSMEKAFKMIEKAKECGADFAKFQFYSPAQVLGHKHPAFAYACQSYFSQAQHETLKRFCDNVGISYLVSVFDIKDVVWAASLCKAMKVATRMNRRQDFLREVDRTKLPVFMSVQPELTIRKEFSKRFNLLWCVAKYPSTKQDILSYPYHGFGLSSHCPDPSATFEAVKAGARIIENHVCESREEIGCDIPASLTFDEYKALIKSCES